MRTKQILFFTMSALLVVGLATTGCSKKTKTAQVPPPAQNQNAETTVEDLANTGDSGIMEGRTSGPMVPVYFAFDSSSVDGEQVARIETNADFLKKNTEINIRIEGNCDPRGTKEYNLALGERRAQSAKNCLRSLGVAPERMATVSFGEEKLLLFGHYEMSWAQNRRDDFVIKE